MRRWMIAGVVVIVITWAMTFFWMKSVQGDTVSKEDGVSEEDTVSGEDAVSGKDVVAAVSHRVLLERNGIRTYMLLEDYLPGVIACQVDPGYSPDVLKCQAVIARTYVERLMDGRSEIHEEELDLDYLEQQSGAYDAGGKSAEENRERLAAGLERCRQAVAETKGCVLQYEQRCILPMFHAMNNGRTRTAGEAYPYLKSVESSWDRAREDGLTQKNFEKQDFAARISRIADTEPVAEDQLGSQIQTVQKDDAGYVVQMKIGSRTYTGEEIQYALELPSACFVLEETGDGMTASVRGSGHGYGLSQAGAEGMAQEGWGYEEILQHYYTGIKLKKSDED